LSRVSRLLSPKDAQELLRVIKDDEDLSIEIENGQVLFQTNETEIVSRLIDGKFPDYEPIIPKALIRKFGWTGRVDGSY